MPRTSGRRRFSFSLRTLLAAMLLFGCGIGWIGHQRREIASRREAIEQQFSDSSQFQPNQPGWNRWLLGDNWPDYCVDIGPRRASTAPVPLGDDDLAPLAGLLRVEQLFLSDTQVTGVGLAGLALPKLKDLHLERSPVVDAGLANLREFPRLESLRLTQTQISDKGLPALSSLTRLRILDLRGTNVTGDGLRHLKPMKFFASLAVGPLITDAGMADVAELRNLKELLIHDAPVVTDAGIAHLSSLAQLELLDLRGTQLTDAGLAHLTKLSKLCFLNISDTLVSDAGMAHVAGLTNLATLQLSGTAVTAAGVESLVKSLPQLSQLGLSGTHMSAAEQAQLKAALPGCKFDF